PLKILTGGPAANETNVPLSTKISITFNKKIKPAKFSIDLLAGTQNVPRGSQSTNPQRSLRQIPIFRVIQKTRQLLREVSKIRPAIQWAQNTTGVSEQSRENP